MLLRQLTSIGSFKVVLNVVTLKRHLAVINVMNVLSQSYENAVAELNKLQSNASVLSKLRLDSNTFNANVSESLRFLRYLNISLDEIDALNCIHVTGTKGKGSTCAFVESILQRFGFRTGFYSSPHLVHVCERIRINGRPLSREDFAQHFFEVHDAIRKNKSEDEPMPGYFKFLTLMAFKVFRDANVDVAIVEVGIGGEHDCTNIIRRPIVCGISTLDFDHVNLLGSTLPEIAWHKAGIAKPGSSMITVDQPADALRVIVERAAERNCPVYVAPDVSAYGWLSGALPSFGVPGQCQHSNVSLSLQLARFWLVHSPAAKAKAEELRGIGIDLLVVGEPKASDELAFKVPEPIVEALEKCFWPGRAQTLQVGAVRFFLDSAHTPQSIAHCANWFRSSSHCESDCLRVLLFHYTSDRDPNVLLSALKDCRFDLAIFCPTRLHRVTNVTSDNTSVACSTDAELKKCGNNEMLWRQLTPEQQQSSTKIFGCIGEAIEFIDDFSLNNKASSKVHVLVTGSLHLVGGVLHFKKPDIL